jgi:hypothetical protein
MRDAKRDLTPITQQLVEAFRANTNPYYLDKKLFNPVYARARRLLKERRQQRAESLDFPRNGGHPDKGVNYPWEVRNVQEEATHLHS